MLQQKNFAISIVIAALLTGMTPPCNAQGDESGTGQVKSIELRRVQRLERDREVSALRESLRRIKVSIDAESSMVRCRQIARQLSYRGDLAGAAEGYQAALDWCRKRGSSQMSQSDVLYSYFNLFEVHLKQKDYTRADSDCQELLSLYTKYQPGLLDVAYGAKADLLQAKGNLTEALIYRRKRDQVVGSRHGGDVSCFPGY